MGDIDARIWNQRIVRSRSNNKFIISSLHEEKGQIFRGRKQCLWFAADRYSQEVRHVKLNQENLIQLLFQDLALAFFSKQ